MSKVINLEYIIFGLSVAMLFIYITAPAEGAVSASLMNLLLLGTVGSFVMLQTLKKAKKQLVFEEPSDKIAIQKIGIGFLLGFVGTLAITYFLTLSVTLVNLLGSVSVESLSQVLTTSNVFFIVLVQPLTETLLLVSMVLVFREILEKSFAALPSTVIAIFVAALIFAGLHFAIIGSAYYEYSFDGFSHFLFDTTGFGTSAYHGALPQLFMGVFWAVIAVGYRSILLAFAAHMANNWLVVFLASMQAELYGLAGTLIMAFGLFIALIVLLVGVQTQFKLLDAFEWKGLTW